MTIVPFPDNSGDNSGSDKLLFPFDLLEAIVDVFGDITVGEALEELKTMPIKDLLKELLP